MATPQFLIPRDAAARLTLSVSRLRQLDQLGELPSMRDSGNRRLYPAEQVEAYARRRAARRLAQMDAREARIDGDDAA